MFLFLELREHKEVNWTRRDFPHGKRVFEPGASPMRTEHSSRTELRAHGLKNSMVSFLKLVIILINNPFLPILMRRPIPEQYRPVYEQAKQQLREHQLLTPQGRSTAEGQQLVEYFFHRLNAPPYFSQANEVLSDQSSLDEVLYHICCLVWYDQSPAQKSQIRQWAAQNHLHPAVAPIMAATYLVESQHTNGKRPSDERTASYTGG